MVYLRKLSLCALAAALLAGCARESSIIEKDRLEGCLRLMGHRNWIVVADSAYPLQSRDGITTVLSDQGQLKTVQKVLTLINEAEHIRGRVYLDREIDYVAEQNAPGINTYRTKLMKLLQGTDVQKIPHEDLIAKLDQSAEVFNVLIIKTNLTLPYTTVFFELDCGYWDAQAEEALRRAMSK